MSMNLNAHVNVSVDRHANMNIDIAINALSHVPILYFPNIGLLGAC